MSERDPRDKKWDDRADKVYDDFTDHPARTGLAWLVKFCVGLVVIALIAGVIFGLGSWISSWGGEAKRVTGVQNTREQAYALRDNYRSLQATAGNVCDAKGASSGENDPQIVGGDAAFQYKATYRRIEADYNRRMDNAFEAGWVRHYPFLNDLPREAPTLEEATSNC